MLAEGERSSRLEEWAGVAAAVVEVVLVLFEFAPTDGPGESKSAPDNAAAVALAKVPELLLCAAGARSDAAAAPGQERRRSRFCRLSLSLPPARAMASVAAASSVASSALLLTTWLTGAVRAMLAGVFALLPLRERAIADPLRTGEARGLPAAAIAAATGEEEDPAAASLEESRLKCSGECRWSPWAPAALAAEGSIMCSEAAELRRLLPVWLAPLPCRTSGVEEPAVLSWPLPARLVELLPSRVLADRLSAPRAGLRLLLTGEPRTALLPWLGTGVCGRPLPTEVVGGEAGVTMGSVLDSALRTARQASSRLDSLSLRPLSCTPLVRRMDPRTTPLLALFAPPVPLVFRGAPVLAAGLMAALLFVTTEADADAAAGLAAADALTRSDDGRRGRREPCLEAPALSSATAEDADGEGDGESDATAAAAAWAFSASLAKDARCARRDARRDVFDGPPPLVVVLLLLLLVLPTSAAKLARGVAAVDPGVDAPIPSDDLRRVSAWRSGEPGAIGILLARGDDAEVRRLSLLLAAVFSGRDALAPALPRALAGRSSTSDGAAAVADGSGEKTSAAAAAAAAAAAE